MKSCARCNVERSLSEFYVYREAIDRICKVCRRAASRLAQAAKRRKAGVKQKVEKPWEPSPAKCDVASPVSKFLRLPRVVL